MFYCDKNINSLFDVVNNELEKVVQWFKANKLSLNIEKTNFMCFTRQKNIDFDNNPQFKIKIDGINIKKVSKINFLGILIDEKLRWHEHINKVAITISRTIGILRKVKNRLNLNAKIKIYNSLILSQLNYCNIIWGNANKTLLNRLLILQNKAIRLILDVDSQEHAPPLFKQLNILTIFDIHKLEMAKFMFKFKQKPEGFPFYLFEDYFRYNTTYHNYPTRQHHNLHLKRFRTEAGRKSIKYSGALFWNNLPDFLQNSISLTDLKSQFKKHFLSEYH